jgi:hypothetical protein
MAVGSIRLGYSLSPHKYGEPLSVNSDLDAAIVDSELFAAARRAFGEWQDGIVAGRWKPRNATEERYWREAGSAVPVNAGRGFVDTKFLPATLPFVRSLHNPLIQVIRKLRTLSGTPKLNAEKSSVRVYRDWPAALRQIEQNIRGLAHHLARASHDPPGGRTT